MPKLFSRDHGGDRSDFPRNRVLHDVHPDDLEDAADRLRERTMSLEREEMAPNRWLIGSIVMVAGGIAAGTVVFRHEIRALLGLG